jgi:hypothetical protein
MRVRGGRGREDSPFYQPALVARKGETPEIVSCDRLGLQSGSVAVSAKRKGSVGVDHLLSSNRPPLSLHRRSLPFDSQPLSREGEGEACSGWKMIRKANDKRHALGTRLVALTPKVSPSRAGPTLGHLEF